jgi:hypothetical protein
VQSVSDQAVGVGVVKGVKPDQQLVKVESVISVSFIDIANHRHRTRHVDTDNNLRK